MNRRAEDPDRPIVKNALLFPGSDGRVYLHVEGENFIERAVPILAQVGEQAVTGLLLRGDGRGFAGILQRKPSPGDRLLVGYADSELYRTRIVVRGQTPLA